MNTINVSKPLGEISPNLQIWCTWGELDRYWGQKANIMNIPHMVKNVCVINFRIIIIIIIKKPKTCSSLSSSIKCEINYQTSNIGQLVNFNELYEL